MDPDTLFKKWGFNRYPFKEFSAELVKDAQSIFFEPPYFKEILSDPLTPKSSIVFGHRGEGKSTICDMIKLELKNNKSAQTLVVPHQDFSGWDRERIDKLTLEDHLERIIGNALKVLLEAIVKDMGIFKKISETSYSSLQWFMLKFYSTAEYSEMEKQLIKIMNSNVGNERLKRYTGRVRRSFRKKSIEINIMDGDQDRLSGIIKYFFKLFGPSVPGTKGLKNLSAMELIKKFKELILEIGFDSIYVLVDKVDEDEVSSQSEEIVAKIISPLVTSLRYLEIDKVATKLFLPMQVKTILGSNVRTDRILTRDINWNEQLMLSVFQKRLLAFSNNRINSLDKFLDPEIRDEFQNKIIHFSGSYPRNMIRILDFIITELCEAEENPEIISSVAIKKGLEHFLNVRLAERDAEEYIKRVGEFDI